MLFLFQVKIYSNRIVLFNAVQNIFIADYINNRCVLRTEI